MGNRAVITNDLNGIGIYLHWNGGRDSVEAFLKYCELKGVRKPESDSSYAFARLAQIISNYFGGTLSIGINQCSKLDCDNGDNGTYIIKGWEIVDRKYFTGAEQNEYDLNEMLQSIDEAQPESEQLGIYLRAKEVPTESLKIGDTVAYIDDIYNTVKTAKVIGIGEDRFVNGHKVLGVPYMDKFGTEDPSSNPNNYICTETARLVENPEPDPVEMFINDEFKGIEIKFASKPSQEVREALKEKGFKWHHKKAVWYAKNTPERLEYVTSLVKELAK